MTSAENMGRNESHRRITSQGINMVKRWSATYDARTRDTHKLLDNTTANEKGLFGEGILDKLDEPLMRYPADPKGAAAEVYNCRCRLNIVPPDYSREANAQAYERWMQENYPDDYRDLNESNYFDRLHKTDEWTSEAQRRVDRRIERLRENNASKGYADANDIVSAVSVQSSNDIELPSAVQRAFDAFERKKQSAKNENYLALDADGNEIFSGTGRGRAVSVPEWANEQSERGYSIHNHPVDVIFSDQDIRNYEEYGLSGGFVITSGGNEYALFNLNPVSHHAEVQAIRRGTGEGYEEALPFSSAASRAFNQIEDDKLMRRRAYIDELNAQGLDRQTQRERLHEWEESEPSVSDRQIEWLEENAERYGFIFRRRRR
jgi:hypothetical protein